MKIYKISQNKNHGYDTYDSAVVCCENEQEARETHPSDYNPKKCVDGVFEEDYGVRCKNSSDVYVQYLGKADEGIEKGVICASFNAG